VFESYLLTLVEAWLRDLAYHWKSEDPPGSEELGKAGLIEKLEGGTNAASRSLIWTLSYTSKPTFS